MSYKFLSVAWEAQIESSDKFVLVSLADQANDAGVCWPSVITLAKRTNLADRSVRRSLATLEQLGYIRRDFRPGHSTNYVLSLTPDVVSPLTQCQDCHSVPTPLTQCPPTPDTVSAITISEPKGEPRSIASPSAKRPKRSLSGYPDGFYPNDSGIAFAAERQVVVRDELIHFENHHRAKGTTMADWQAGWKTWCLNSVKFRKPNMPTNRQSRRDEVIATLTGRSPRPVKDVFSGTTIEGELL